MGLFSKAGAIGLNISDFSVEALQLKSYESPQKFEVQGWGRAVLPSGLIINGALAGK
ncbi:MAG: hypothetical protein HY602_02740, partial [Parcubacteria group bacterium]|nr:hypothetical protein [Parcubacteria group bacterium]